MKHLGWSKTRKLLNIAHGSAPKWKPTKEEAQAIFNERIAERTYQHGECWLVHGHTTDKDGYKSLHLRSRGHSISFRIHRLSYLAFNGEIPDGMKVCHQCDTPGCCNPDHLFLGTTKDNNKDAIAKGRRQFERDSNGRFLRFLGLPEAAGF